LVAFRFRFEYDVMQADLQDQRILSKSALLRDCLLGPFHRAMGMERSNRLFCGSACFVHQSNIQQRSWGSRSHAPIRPPLYR